MPELDELKQQARLRLQELQAPPEPTLDDLKQQARARLGLTGPDERAGLDYQATKAAAQDRIRDIGGSYPTPPLAPADPDFHAARAYNVKPDISLDDLRRNNFVKNTYADYKSGAELPGIYNILNPDSGFPNGLDPNRAAFLDSKIKDLAAVKYNILKQPPSGEESLKAIDAGLQLWSGPNPVLPGVRNTFSKWLGTGTDKFNSDDKALYDQIGGQAAFPWLQSHLNFFVGKQRLEKYLGRALPNPPNQDAKDLVYLPSSYPLRLEHLAPKDPDLAELAQTSAAIQQGNQQGGAFVSKQTFGLPLTPIPGYRPGAGWNFDQALKDITDVEDAMGAESSRVNAQMQAGSITAGFKGLLSVPMAGLEKLGNLPPLEVPNVIPGSQSLKAGDYSRQVWNAGMLAEAGFGLAAAPFLTGAFLATPWATDKIDQYTGGAITTHAAAMLHNAARYLAAGAGADFSTDKGAINLLLDHLPAGTDADVVRDHLALLPSSDLAVKLADAWRRSDSPTLRVLGSSIQDNPFLNDRFGSVLSLADNPGDAFATALGLGLTGLGVVQKLTPIKEPVTPLNRYGKFDYASRTSSAAEAARGAMLKKINAAVNDLNHASDARPLIDRTVAMLKTAGGPLTAEDTGVVLDRLAEIRRTTDGLGDAPIRPETKQALIDAVKPVLQVGPTETFYAVTGQRALLGIPERNRILPKLAEAFEKTRETGQPEPALALHYDTPELQRLTRAFADKLHADQTAYANKDRLLSVADEVADQINARNPARAETVSTLHRRREALVAATNDHVANLLDQAVTQSKTAESLGTYQGPVEKKFGTLRANITEKLAAGYRDGAIADLTEDEVKYLNDVQGTAKGPLIARFDLPGVEALNIKEANAAHRALLDDLKTHQAGIDADTKRLQTLAKFRARVLASDPDTPGFKVPISKTERLLFKSELLGEANTKIGRRYASIHPGYSTDTLSSIEAFEEAAGSYRRDVAAVSNGPLRHLSAWESRVLLNSAAHKGDFPWAVQRILRDGQDWENFILSRTKAAHDAAGKEGFNLTEAMNALSDASQGKASSPLAQGYMRQIREAVGKVLIQTGVVDRATWTKWIENPSYYHGLLLPDDAASLPRQSLYNTGPYKRLTVRSDFADPKIPETEGGYHIVWREGGQNHYKEFPSPKAAEAFLTSSDAKSLLPADTEVDIRRNLPFSTKTLYGIAGDPRISFLDLIRDQSKAGQRAHLNQTFANTPFVKTDSELAAGRFVPKSDTEAIAPDGKHYFKVTNPGALHLYDKWVSQDVLHYLDLYNHGQDFFSEGARGIQASTGLWDLAKGRQGNPLLNHYQELFARAGKALLGKAAEGGAVTNLLIRIPRNIIAFSKLATSVAAHVNQWGANLTYNMPAAGFDPFAPGNWTRTLEYWQRYKKHLQTGDDPVGLDIERNGSVPINRLEYVNHLNDLEKAYTSDMKSLRQRIDFHDAQATKALDAGDHDLASAHAAKVGELQEKLASLEPKSYGAFMHAWGKVYMNGIKPIIEGALQGKGPANDYLWKQFGVPDNFAKFATHAYLTEVRGMSSEAALEIADRHLQNLNRAPAFVKELGNHMGGGIFLSYQASVLQTLANALRYRKMHSIARLGLVAAWNTGMLHEGLEDPDDAMNTWSWQNHGQAANISTKLAYLTSRVLFPGGRGGLSLGNVLFDVFGAQSTIGHHIDENIKTSNLPSLAKAGLQLANGITSHYLMSGPALNIAADTVKGTDYRGRPYQGVGDWMADQLRKFAPSTLTDGYETIMRGAGMRWDEYAGVKKEALDWIAQRLFHAIRPEEVSDPALYRATMQFVLQKSRRPGFWQSPSNDDTLRLKMLQDPSYDPRTRKWDEPGRLQQIAKDHYDGLGLSLPIGNVKVEQSDKALQAAVESNRLPGIISAFHSLKLDEMLQVYALTRTARPNPHDTWVERHIKDIIDDRASSKTVAEELSSDSDFMKREFDRNVTAVLSEPDLPAAAKANIRGWVATVDKAVAQHKISKVK